VIVYKITCLLTGWAGVLLVAHGVVAIHRGRGTGMRSHRAVVSAGPAIEGWPGQWAEALLGVGRLVLEVLLERVSLFNVAIGASEHLDRRHHHSERV